MTITLTKDIREAGSVVAAGTTIVRDAATEADLISRGFAVPAMPESGAMKSNSFIRINPTRVCTPVSSAGAAGYTSSLTGGATIAVDTENTDPLSGLGTAKLIMGGGDASVQTVQFDSLPNGGLSPGDAGVWIIPVWIDSAYDVLDATVSIGLRLSKLTSPSGSDYRDYGWFAGGLHSGWNILCARNVETSVGNAEYGVVGHMPFNTGQVWTQPGATTPQSTILSARLRIYAPGRTIRVGGIYLAPENWAKSIVVWGFDDVLKSVATLALPIIERFGWRATLFPSVQYATDAASYMSMTDLRYAQSSGHDVWSHSLSHYDMTTGTLAEKERQARETKSFWKSNGFPNAGKYGSYPFLKHDATSMSVMTAAGFDAVRAGAGRMMCPLAPLLSPGNLPAVSLETANSWHADAYLNGAIKRGQVICTYMHEPVSGGAGIDTQPAATKFYVDHLRRWCGLVQDAEERGECVVMTMSEIIRAFS